MSLLILQGTFQGRYLYPHFTDKNTEAQSGKVPCAVTQCGGSRADGSNLVYKNIAIFFTEAIIQPE